MGSEYDENLDENPFFQQLRQTYGEILKTASENSWIICIPRLGAFSEPIFSKNDISAHILIPIVNNQHYQNLNHTEIEKTSDVLVFKCNDLTRRVRVLFTEDFVVGNLKYSVWCIEEALHRNQTTKRAELLEISSFCDCINFLWTDTIGCKLLEEINLIVHGFLYQCNIEELDLLQLRNVMQNSYDHCLYKALEYFQTHLEDENFLNNLKLAVETFMYACVKDKLFNCLCTITANSDASLNKIIRNSQDIPLRAFKISHEFYDVLPMAKLEINKINNTYTTLNKIMCLKRTFKVLSKDVLSSEILLEIFIFLILKSNIYNWTANVIFMAKFRFSDVETSHENNFLITTLQAALKYISDDGLRKLEYKADFESSQSDFRKLVSFIENGNLDSLISAVTYTDKLSKQMCHPLCSCDNCELLLKTNTCQIDSRDDKGRSLLHIAAKGNRCDVLQSLIAKGASVDAADYSGLTPLHYAVSAGYQQAAFLLLHAGCGKNIRDSEGNTPLHIATRNGQDNCVKTLIYFTEDHGSDLEINCINNSGDTPLHFAAKYGYMNLVNLLIEYGAKIVFNNRSLSPYNIAHNDLIRNILKNVAILTKEVTTKPTLFRRLLSSDDITLGTDRKYKHSQKVKQKIIANCCKKVSGNFGMYPKNLDQFKKTDLLLKAIENNDLPLSCFYLGIPMPHTSSMITSNCHPLCTCEKCVELIEDEIILSDDFKQETLNINICNPDGYTPLHIAAKYGRIEILRLLLDAGAVVNLKTYKTFQTPLHLACIFREKHIVKEILKCGNCCIDPLDSNGNTPLHYACLNNDLEIFEILISHGADASIKNHEGKSVTDEANQRVFCNITRILKERIDHTKFDIDNIL